MYSEARSNDVLAYLRHFFSTFLMCNFIHDIEYSILECSKVLNFSRYRVFRSRTSEWVSTERKVVTFFPYPQTSCSVQWKNSRNSFRIQQNFETNKRKIDIEMESLRSSSHRIVIGSKEFNMWSFRTLIILSPHWYF